MKVLPLLVVAGLAMPSYAEEIKAQCIAEAYVTKAGVVKRIQVRDGPQARCSKEGEQIVRKRLQSFDKGQRRGRVEAYYASIDPNYLPK